MFTFQSIMFVSLGFLCALLLGFVVAPAFWARAVRLTTERMRASLPLTEREISAERDKLRAENAIRVHQLTAKIEQARLYEARQKVEINRRDGTITGLQRRLQLIETEREGSENARRVLEATIKHRVPEVEGRLLEARQLLVKRDTEMKALQADTARTFRALDDAMQVNAQQRAEIDRLQMALAGQGMRMQHAPGGSESEMALRAELEKLRARSREQALLINRLQSAAHAGTVVSGGRPNGAAARAGRRPDAELIPLKPLVANDDEGWEAPDALSSEKGGRAEIEAVMAGHQAEVADLKAKLDEQNSTIEMMKGQLQAYERADAGGSGRSLSLRDTKTVLKSRVAAAQLEIAAKEKSIVGLRRELAAANERLARQATYYQEELRRLGTRNSGAGSTGRPSSVASHAARSQIPPKTPASSRPLPPPEHASSRLGGHGQADLPSALPQSAVLAVDDAALRPAAPDAIPPAASQGPLVPAQLDASAHLQQPAPTAQSSAAPSSLPIVEPRSASVTPAPVSQDAPVGGAALGADQPPPEPEAAPTKPEIRVPEPRGKLMDRIAGLAKR